MILIKKIILSIVIIIAVVCIMAVAFPGYFGIFVPPLLPKGLKSPWIFGKFVFPGIILISLGLIGNVISRKRKRLLILWGILFFVGIVLWMFWVLARIPPVP